MRGNVDCCPVLQVLHAADDIEIETWQSSQDLYAALDALCHLSAYQKIVVKGGPSLKALYNLPMAMLILKNLNKDNLSSCALSFVSSQRLNREVEPLM